MGNLRASATVLRVAARRQAEQEATERLRSELLEIRAKAGRGEQLTRLERMKLIRAAADRHAEMFAEVAERKRQRQEDEAAASKLVPASEEELRLADPVADYLRESEAGQNEFGVDR